MTAEVLLYPGLILILTAFLLITVPRPAWRVLLPYGVILGGLLDYVHHLLLGTLLRILAYQNLGIFHASGHAVLAHLAWTLVMIFYFYFYPKDNKYVDYLYLIAFALLATAFSQVIEGAGLFSYTAWFYPIPMFLTFLARFALATWLAQHWKLDWQDK